MDRKESGLDMGCKVIYWFGHGLLRVFGGLRNKTKVNLESICSLIVFDACLCDHFENF